MFILKLSKFILHSFGLPLLTIGELLTGRRIIKLIITRTNIVYGIRILGNKSYIYVGKTDVKNLETRKRTHITKSYRKQHVNKRLQQTIRNSKFAVTFDILCYCNSDNVFEKEAYYINKYKTNKLCNIIIPD